MSDHIMEEQETWPQRTTRHLVGALGGRAHKVRGAPSAMAKEHAGCGVRGGGSSCRADGNLKKKKFMVGCGQR